MLDLGFLPPLHMAAAQLLTGPTTRVIGADEAAALRYGEESAPALAAAAVTAAPSDEGGDDGYVADTGFIHFIASHAEFCLVPPSPPPVPEAPAPGGAAAGVAPIAPPPPPAEPMYAWKYDLPAITAYVLSRFIAGRARLDMNVLVSSTVFQASKGSLTTRALARGAYVQQPAAEGAAPLPGDVDVHTPEGRLRLLASELVTAGRGGPLEAAAIAAAAREGLSDADLRGIHEAVARPAGGKAGLDALCAELLALSEAAGRAGPARLATLRESSIASLATELGLKLAAAHPQQMTQQPLSDGDGVGDSSATRHRQLTVAALPALALAVSEAVSEQVRGGGSSGGGGRAGGGNPGSPPPAVVAPRRAGGPQRARARGRLR